MILKKTPVLIFLSFFMMMSIVLFGQNKDSLSKEKTDSLPSDFMTKMQAFAKISSKKSAADLESDKATITQAKVFDEIKKTMQKAKIYLRTGIDTTGIKAELDLIEKDFTIASDGVFTNKGTAQTFRNLTATSKILIELSNKAIARKVKLDVRLQELNNFRYRIDSLLSVPALFKFSQDSVILSKYLQQIVIISYETHPIDSAIKQANNNVQSLLNQVNLVVFKLQLGLEEIELYQKNMADNVYKREFDNIWNPEGYSRPFSEIANYSQKKGQLTLSFYLQNNRGVVGTLFLLIIASFVYLTSLKNIYKEQNLLNPDFDGQLVIRYPLFSSLVIVVSLFQFVFFSPPFILSVIFWVISSISLSILFKNFISKYWMNIWLIMVCLFLVAAIDNFVLQASRAERWLMLVISILGVAAALVVLLKGRRDELKEKWIVYSIALMGLIEFGAALSNIFGRYNLSKSLLISGYLNVIIAILFLWTARLINEALFLAYNVYTRQDKKLFYLNFQRVGTKVPVMFYVLLVFGWIVLFGRNFPAFESFAKPLGEFFSRDRTIGDYTFSINNLLLFIAIMVISVVISKIVSFFASDHFPGAADDKQGKQGIGSWLLLVRITILSMGLFLAVAAAGIPLGKITIVLGALGVGIGFGLQTLVNNLVSGLIIAFEKPVNVGDVVDIDGQGGTMKSIGFRSSVIYTWEGADMVIPNGDLLNSHLMNWSLGGSRKRMTIKIGVAYDSDLDLAKKILAEILDAEDRLAKNPHYIIQYEQFNDSAIELKIYFWAKHMKDALTVQSDLIMVIKNTFSQKGISIPFAQYDVYMHPINNTDIDKLPPSK
jgi:potassium efflux system protein